MRVRGVVIGERPALALVVDGDPCQSCRYRNTWICKRFFTKMDILPYLESRKVVAVRFASHRELLSWAWWWADHFYRMYGWDTIPIAAFHCDICGDPDKYCGERFCKWRVLQTWSRPTPKPGYKKFWWCSRYLYIELPREWQRDNIMCYLVRDTEPYSWLGKLAEKVREEEKRWGLCQS